ncbi:MAG: family membership [Acidobacteriota bacterium]|nr:family membership [Acidobacteriota bacterium]
MPVRRLVKRLAKAIVALAVFAVIALMILFVLLWREHRTELTLPAPTGRFAVGRTIFTWVNDAETDALAPSPGTRRQVVVWIWYPASNAASASSAGYLPTEWREAFTRSSGVLMSQFLTRDLSLVRTHSTVDPEVSPAEKSYPVVIMRAGGGALTATYTTLAEDLASHGYIVAGFDAPYRTTVVVLPNKRVITRVPKADPEDIPAAQADRLINRLLSMWVDDTKFVVNQLQRLNESDPSGRFTGRLDMERLGMFGHSFGSAQTLQFCHEDARCKAGIDIDGAPYGSVVQEGLTQPFMFIFSDHSREMSDPASRKILSDIQSIYDRLPDGRLLITIRGANHFSFSDQMLLKSHYLIGVLRLFGFGNLGARRGLAITAEYVHTFFDVYLKGAPLTLLKGLSEKYPEVAAGPHWQ